MLPPLGHVFTVADVSAVKLLGVFRRELLHEHLFHLGVESAAQTSRCCFLSPGLPLLQALPLLSGTVGIFLKLIGKQHAVMARVLDEVPQTVVVPKHGEKYTSDTSPTT